MSYDDLVRNLTKNKVNNPVFSCYNFSNNKKIPVDSRDVIKFYKEYSDKINEETEVIPTLGEVSEDNIPIISEFIFKFEKDEENNEEDIFYNQKLIHGLIICHHKVIRNLITLNSANAEYICVVNQSKVYNEQNLNCIKLHLRFPYCCLGKYFIRNTFRNKLLTQIRKAKLEKFFTISSPLGDWSSHLQDVKDIYTLYGSSESKTPPALFLGVFGEYKDGICKSLSLEKAYDFKNHHFIKNGKCNIDDLNLLETVDEEEDNHLLLLPIFTSVFFYSSISNIKINNDNNAETASSSQSEDYEERINHDSDLEIALELIEMLNEERFEKENYFIDIGAALYSATKGSEEGLKIWMRIGIDKQKDEDEEYYEEKYDAFDNSHITIKTLGWYAKKDNLEAYKDWHKRWCLPKIRDCVTSQGAHVPVAEAFYRVFWLDYMFSRGKWYSFSDHTLKPLNEVIPLRNSITNGLIPYFESFRNQTSSAKKENKGGEHSRNLEAVLKEIKKIVKNLYTESYRSQIINSSQTYFWKENITKILNKNPNILGMKNGVIELTEEKAIVRPGKPEDFITKMIGVRYKYKYNWQHKDVQALLLYLRQVFPNESVNHHMKKDISSFLYGRNKEKKFRVWIGDTNGSKSIYQKIIRRMLGDYYCDLPPEYYSAQQKSGSGPNPELAQTEDCHVGFSAEMDDDMSIKAPRIKRVTGGDSYFVRNCNQDGGSIETTFKPILVLNNVPDIQGMEEATKTRFSMVPYESRWLRPEEIDKLDFELPEDIEEQIKLKTFVMDGDFDKNIPTLANALLWIAVQYYETYLEEGLKDPPYMQHWMDDYWKKNDCYTSFIAERLENPMVSVECKSCKNNGENCKECNNKGFVEEIDISKSITATELYPEFRRWFYETYPNKKKDQLPDKKKFVSVMSNKDKLKPQHNRRWYGVVLRTVNSFEE